jgi:hypothetical protein
MEEEKVTWCQRACDTLQQLTAEVNDNDTRVVLALFGQGAEATVGLAGKHEELVGHLSAAMASQPKLLKLILEALEVCSGMQKTNKTS